MCGVAQDDQPTWSELGAAQQQPTALLCSVLNKLQQMVPESAADVSIVSIFCSFGQLGVNSNALLPGALDSLAQHFTLDIDVATGQPLAQVLKACVQTSWTLSRESFCRPCSVLTSQLARREQTLPVSAHQFSQTSLSGADIKFSLSRLPTTEPSKCP